MSFTEGFTPRPRLTFLSPLAVGVEAWEDAAVIFLGNEYAEGEVRDRLNAQLPVDASVLRVEKLPPGGKVEPIRAEYAVTLPERVSGLEERIASFLNLPSAPVSRDGKIVDLRPFVLSLRPLEMGFEAEVRMTKEGGVRPFELLDALSVPREGARIVRRRLVLRKSGHENPDAH